jgi:cyclophilin family peptidyl-prolyl cis-trans isomerase
MYYDLAPNTAQYFADLLTTKVRGYLGSTLSKVVADGYIVGGDLKEAPPIPV